jgi:hypothetical protein
MAHQLCAKNWKGKEQCALCGADEDIDHLVFSCPMANFVWTIISEALGGKGPQVHGGPTE